MKTNNFKKVVAILMMMVMVLTTSNSFLAYATEPEVESIPVVKSDKVWKITFNKPINQDNVTHFINVQNENEEQHPITIEIDQNVVSIVPVEPYKTGKYTLYIKSGIQAEDGCLLIDNATQEFIVDEPTDSTVVTNPTDTVDEPTETVVDQPTDTVNTVDQSIEPDYEINTVSTSEHQALEVDMAYLEEVLSTFGNSEIISNWDTKVEDGKFYRTDRHYHIGQTPNYIPFDEKDLEFQPIARFLKGIEVLGKESTRGEFTVVSVHETEYTEDNYIQLTIEYAYTRHLKRFTTPYFKVKFALDPETYELESVHIHIFSLCYMPEWQQESKYNEETFRVYDEFMKAVFNDFYYEEITKVFNDAFFNVYHTGKVYADEYGEHAQYINGTIDTYNYDIKVGCTLCSMNIYFK